MRSMFPVYQFHTSCSRTILCGSKMLLLLSFWIITGLVAEDLKVTYQLKASSVCLYVNKSQPYGSAQWKFNEKIVVHDNTVNPKYAGKLVYNPGNLSLCINNLMDTDAGTYDVTIVSNFIPVSEKHQIIVQDPVPRPVIVMSDHCFNMSAGLCNITVNCSIGDEWLWSHCVQGSCSTSQKAFSNLNITIYSNNGSVICSGSNYVSTSSASEPIKKCCSKLNTEDKEEPVEHLRVPVHIIIAFIGFVLCVLFLVLFLVILVKKKVPGNCKSYQLQTSAVRSIQSQPLGTLPPGQPRGSTGSSSSDGDPAYENADIIETSHTSSPREETSSTGMNKVDTIYCLADGNASSANNTQKTSEAAATVEEAQRPTQIDTVYSVLKKP